MTDAPSSVAAIAARIHFIRGLRVLLDNDLAELFGVSTKRFNEAVKRNSVRFPAEFMFQLTQEESSALRSQFATSNVGRGGRRHRPYAFTEHGALMAATILNSSRAVDISVYVIRAFVQFRDLLAHNKELASRLNELEMRMEEKFASQDSAIADILAAIRRLINPVDPPRRRIGFVSDPDSPNST